MMTMSLTSTSENIKRLEDKIAHLEDELRVSDRARNSLLKMNEDLQAKNRKLQATVGILKRAILILNEQEVDG